MKKKFDSSPPPPPPPLRPLCASSPANLGAILIPIPVEINANDPPNTLGPCTVVMATRSIVTNITSAPSETRNPPPPPPPFPSFLPSFLPSAPARDGIDNPFQLEFHQKHPYDCPDAVAPIGSGIRDAATLGGDAAKQSLPLPSQLRLTRGKPSRASFEYS